MNLEEYRTQFQHDDPAAPGWLAIDARLGAVYPGVEPQHWGTIVKYSLGGDDPLDGISCYRATGHDGSQHFHYVTYGFSSLYFEEESVGGEYSGYGFELTFRLKPLPGETEPPMWPLAVLQQLARYVFKSGNIFDDNHWAGTSGGAPMADVAGSEITGMAFLTDPVLGVIDTPHGEVKFLQIVGLTAAEMQTLPGPGARARAAAVLERLQASDPLLVTDLLRK